MSVWGKRRISCVIPFYSFAGFNLSNETNESVFFSLSISIYCTVRVPSFSFYIHPPRELKSAKRMTKRKGKNFYKRNLPKMIKFKAATFPQLRDKAAKMTILSQFWLTSLYSSLVMGAMLALMRMEPSGFFFLFFFNRSSLSPWSRGTMCSIGLAMDVSSRKEVFLGGPFIMAPQWAMYYLTCMSEP